MPYKLSTSLRGHELDVRGVCAAVFPAGGVITCSRDRTSRVWVPDEVGKSFSEGHLMSGHTNFVSAVCTVPPSDKYPRGLIVTGGNDKLILLWTLDAVEPVERLTGHEGTVCALVAGRFGTILSGSWDKTGKVWLGNKCMITLKGHEAAVWAVEMLPEQGLMLTGSADKTIRMWKAGGTERIFKGHADCVRGLVALSSVEFLSCSNDSTIRRWLTTGECTQVYHGHTSFIYSLAAFPDNPGSFVSVGEDRSLRIWKDGNCEQTITLPAQSVWSVACLANGDIVTGSSDGIARIFTSSPERIAADEELQQFDKEVASHAIPAAAANGQLGDIKLDEVPGPERLLRPGNKDGQTTLVRKGNLIEAHTWNATENTWTKVGEVVGAEGSEGAAREGNKTMFEGKDYDYVFDVALSEDKPAYKLPFNITDDPYMAAHTFLEKNDLSPLFLDQVANFIMENTKGVQLGAPDPSFVDPFTGAGRYVPSGSSSSSDIVPTGDGMPSIGGAADPFTGSGGYKPSYVSFKPRTTTTPQESDSSGKNPFFPKETFLTFDSANVNAIIQKLEDFNEKIDMKLQISEKELHMIKEFLQSVGGSGTPTAEQVSLVTKLLSWPPEQIFPVLDILRLATRHETVNRELCKDGHNLVPHIIQFITPDGHIPNVLLSLRILAHFFTTEEGLALMLHYRDQIINRVNSCFQISNKNVRISYCSLLINYSVVLKKQPDFDAKAQCLSSLNMILQAETDNEARFRAMVAVGTMVTDDPDALSLAQSLGTQEWVQKLTSLTDPAKVGDCAKHLMKTLS